MDIDIEKDFNLNFWAKHDLRWPFDKPYSPNHNLDKYLAISTT